MRNYLRILLVLCIFNNAYASWEEDVTYAVKRMHFDSIVDNKLFERHFLKHNLPIEYIDGRLVIKASIHGKWRVHNGHVVRDFSEYKGDHHLLTVGGNNVLVKNLYLDNDRNFAEALKFSRSINIVVSNNTIKGGYEDAVDIVQGINYTFLFNTIITDGFRAMTIKGGVVRADLVGNKFLGKPKSDNSPGGRHYIDFGNWGDLNVIDQRRTQQIRLSYTNSFEDSSAYEVRMMHAKKIEARTENIYKMSNFMLNIFWSYQTYTNKKRVLNDPKYKDQLTWNSKNNPTDYPHYQGNILRKLNYE